MDGVPNHRRRTRAGGGATSLIFLTAILVIVVFLSVTRADAAESPRSSRPVTTTPGRERVMIGYLAVVAIACAGVLVWGGSQPHAAVASEEGPRSSVTLPAGQSATANFPADAVTEYRTIADDTLTLLQAGDQAGAAARVTDLETAWDRDQSSLQPLDGTAWTVLDGRIDDVLTAVRAPSPDTATEIDAVSAFLNTLSS